MFKLAEVGKGDRREKGKERREKRGGRKEGRKEGGKEGVTELIGGHAQRGGLSSNH